MEHITKIREMLYDSVGLHGGNYSLTIGRITENEEYDLVTLDNLSSDVAGLLGTLLNLHTFDYYGSLNITVSE